MTLSKGYSYDRPPASRPKDDSVSERLTDREVDHVLARVREFCESGSMRFMCNEKERKAFMSVATRLCNQAKLAPAVEQENARREIAEMDSRLRAALGMKEYTFAEALNVIDGMREALAPAVEWPEEPSTEILDAAGRTFRSSHSYSARELWTEMYKAMRAAHISGREG